MKLSRIPASFRNARTAIPVVFLSALCHGSLLAQVAPAPTSMPVDAETTVLNPFEVQAGKNEGYQAAGVQSASKLAMAIKDVPNTVTVLTEQFLKDIAAQNLGDAMQWVTGVSSNLGARNQDGFSIRGFGAILTYVDGFRDSQEWGSGEMAQVAQLEILKGPASNLYGNMRGFGGVINRVTKKPQDKNFQQAEVVIGSFDQYRFTFDTTGPISTDKSWMYRVNAAYTNNGSYRDLRHLKRYFVTPVITKRLSPATTLTFSLELLRTETQEDLGVPLQIDPATNTLVVTALPRSRQLGEPWENTTLEKESGRLYFNHKINQNWSVRAAAITTFWNNPIEQVEALSIAADRRTLTRQAFHLNRWENHHVFEVDLNGKFTTGPFTHNVLFGYEWNRENGRSNVTRRPLASIDIYNPVYGTPKPDFTLAIPATNLHFQNGIYGYFANDQVTFWKDHISVFYGMRWDRATSHRIIELPVPSGADVADPANYSTTPRYGFVLRPDINLRIYAQYSEAFQPIFGSTTPDFKALNPTVGSTREAGVKRTFFNGRLNVEVAYYKIENSNVAVRLQPPLNSFFANAGSQYRIGQELNFGYNTGNFNIIGGIIQSRSKQDLNPGITAPVITPYHTSWQMSGKYTFPREGVFKGLSVGLGAYPRRNVIYTALSRNGTLPAYTRFDLSMGYKVNPKLDFNLNVYNLTDEMYYLGVVSPTIFPGSPRGFRGTMRYTF